MPWVMVAMIEARLLAPFKFLGAEVVAQPPVIPTLYQGDDGHAGLSLCLQVAKL
ncbi:hypothetical protein P368_22080 [Comamonas thiooxydans]|jgi:hypothetical protein|nr:hypothetical protein P365_24185 [Comamonas thiooxydans]KGH06203.1 hypothetical protein P368_22080 [Comamonas thiooxydans]